MFSLSTGELADWLLRAVAIVMLVRIGVADFREHKIYNGQLLQLLAVAIALVLLRTMLAASLMPALYSAGVAAAIFAVLFVFWTLGKVGAGDVKLLGIVPLLVGYEAMLPLSITMLVLSLMTYFLMRFPLVLPERWFRSYIQSLDASGRVPFGVPISAAAILVLLLPIGLSGVATAPEPSQVPPLSFDALETLKSAGD